jgi:hypothetical protein
MISPTTRCPFLPSLGVAVGSTFLPFVLSLCLLALLPLSLYRASRLLRETFAVRTWKAKLHKSAMLLLVLVPWLLFAWCVESLDEGRPRLPLSMAAVSQLRQIGVSFMVYADDNEGHLPPSLGGLFPYWYDGGIYVIRDSDTPVPKDAADVDSGQCDFLYFGPELIGKEEAATAVLVTTKPTFYEDKGFVCVLYLDGRAESYTSVPDSVQALWQALSEGVPAATAER